MYELSATDTAIFNTIIVLVIFIHPSLSSSIIFLFSPRTLFLFLQLHHGPLARHSSLSMLTVNTIIVLDLPYHSTVTTNTTHHTVTLHIPSFPHLTSNIHDLVCFSPVSYFPSCFMIFLQTLLLCLLFSPRGVNTRSYITFFTWVLVKTQIFSKRVSAHFRCMNMRRNT